MSKSRELRAKARTALGSDIFGKLWLYPVVIMLLYSVITGVASSTGIGTLLLSGILSVCLSSYFLAKYRGTETEEGMESAYVGFKSEPLANMGTGILVGLFTFLWSLLFVIPGIIKAYSYAMTFYIRVDHPEYTATQSITESRRLMDGNKWRFFCLSLSFIGWDIVSVLTFGIASFWVGAYKQMAFAAFYEELKETKADSDVFSDTKTVA